MSQSRMAAARAAPAYDSPVSASDDVTFNRRQFVALSAAALAAPAAMLDAATAASPHMLQLNGYAVNAETPLELLTDYLTPTDLFFVRSHWIPRTPDLAKWKLSVTGEVERPLELTLAALKKMKKSEMTCVLQCAGNGRGLYAPLLPGVQWQYGAVGNARWGGVRVRDVLELAGVKPSARHLHTFGSDDPPSKVPPFHRSVELDKLQEDGLLAWEMNGAPLMKEHGAPLRLVVPGWAGDHWMKWLVRISAEPEPQKGFYMETAYRYPLKTGAPGVAFKPEEMKPLTAMFVKSNITTAPKKARIGHAVTVSGFAFSGAPDVVQVEVSDDDGSTWNEAALDPRPEPYAWRRWSLAWTPAKSGMATLLVRATDSRGDVQPRNAVWNQSGYLYNSWHSADIEVTA
jgi:sulfite oxidase